MVKLTKIESGKLLYLFKPVNQRIAVYKQLAGRFGDVQIVVEETLNGEKRLMVESLDRALFEYLFEEGLAKGGGQLINKTGYSEIVVADYRFFGIEHLADLKGDLGILKGTGKLLYSGDRGAYSDHRMGVKFAREGVGYRMGKVFEILGLNILAYLLYKDDILLAYVYNKILVFVREEILYITRISSTTRVTSELNLNSLALRYISPGRMLSIITFFIKFTLSYFSS